MTANKKANWRKLQNAVFVAINILWAVPGGASQYLYSVDFHSPLNQIGQPPAVAMGSQTPSSIVFGNPVVVGSFGHLTNQPLLFSAIGYQQIQFDIARMAHGYFVDFDFETHNLNPSLFAFAVVFDAPEVQVFDLHGSGYIGVPNSPFLPGWSDDRLHHMRIEVDLARASWTFQLDDRMPVMGPFLSTSDDILSIRINLSAWHADAPDDPGVQVAIDNVVIGALGPDSDEDGVLDFEDLCPHTLSGAIVEDHGCSIDQLVPCEGPRAGGAWRNHGQYLSSVDLAAEAFLAAGLITRREKNAILATAAQSSCGKK